MGEVRDAAWYDDAFRSSEEYLCRPEDSPFFPLWREVVPLVPAGARVVDLGCGPAHLAELLAGRITAYCGVDFSEEALGLAAARLRAMQGSSLPWDLRRMDFSHATSAALPEGTCYVAVELLEHVADDTGLLSRIPAGARVIASLPSRDSAGHARWFPMDDLEASERAIETRYGSILSNRMVTICGQWWIVEGDRAAAA